MRRRQSRRFRRRRGRRVSRFARIVRRLQIKNTEPKSIIISTSDGTNLQEGDGTSRALTIYNVPSNLTQGIQEDQFIGNKVWLKGLSIRGQVSTQSAAFQGFLIRWTLFKSRSNAAAMTGAGASYTSATTAAAVPTQTQPFQNPLIFTGSGNVQFVGDGFTRAFDPTNVKVIGSFTLHVNNSGASQDIVKFKHYFKINKMFQFLDSTDTGDLSTAPNHGKYGSYYLIRQVVAVANSVATTVVGVLDHQHQLYFRDP